MILASGYAPLELADFGFREFASRASFRFAGNGTLAQASGDEAGEVLDMLRDGLNVHASGVVRRV